jgi:hypothetical protein
MAEVLKIASEISTPIGLAGFAFAALFLIIHQLIKANKIPRLTGAGSLKLIDRMFILAVIAMALARRLVAVPEDLCRPSWRDRC